MTQSLADIWAELKRLKRHKVEYGDFYRLQRKLGLSTDAIHEGTVKKKFVNDNDGDGSSGGPGNDKPVKNEKGEKAAEKLVPVAVVEKAVNISKDAIK